MESKMVVEVQLVSEHTKFTWRTNYNFERKELYDFVHAIMDTFFEKDSPVRVSIDIAETFNEQG